MYTLKKSYVKEGYAWRDEDIGAWLLRDVLKLKNARMTVSRMGDIDRDFFMSENYAHMVGYPAETTVAGWLAGLETGVLETTLEARGLVDSNVVKFRDLHDYEVDLETHNVRYGNGVDIPEGMDTDLRFRTHWSDHDERSTKNLAKNTLAVVNGFVYPMTWQSGWAYILDGNAAIRLSTERTVSLIDFTDIGGIDTVYIDPDMVRKAERTDKDKALNRTRFSITLPKSTVGYTPLLVLDGYLHVLDGAYSMISSTEMKINLSHRLAIFRGTRKPRYTRNWINPANLRGNGFNIDTFDAEAYLKSTHSFIVLVKTTDLCVRKEPVIQTNASGLYTHYRVPLGMLRFEDGQLAPYYIGDFNEFECQINTLPNVRPQYVMDLTDWSDVSGMTDHGLSEQRYHYKTAYVLDLYSFA